MSLQDHFTRPKITRKPLCAIHPSSFFFSYTAQHKVISFRLLHHTSHTAHTTHAAHATHRRTTSSLLLRGINDGNLSSAQKRGNTASVDETSADDLEGVKDTGVDHVNVLALGAIETLVEVTGVLVSELADNDGALKASVLDDGSGRACNGVLDDADTELLVEVGSRNLVKSVGRGLDKGSTTTGQDTLLNGGTGGVQGIDKSVLLLADLNLGGATNLDDGNTSRELSKTLLELLLLVLRGGRVGNDTTDLLASLSNGVLATAAVQDNGVLLCDSDRTGRTEHVRSGLVKLNIKLISEDSTVGEDSKIAEDGLAVVTEARGLDSSNLELATELVQNANGESLTLNVLSNDDKRPSLLGRDLKSGDDVLNSRDLLLGEEDERVLKLDLLGLGIGDEVGGDEATVESHTLGDLELISNGLALLAGDDTLLANLLHGVGNHLADVDITVGGDGSNLSDLSAGGNITLVLLEELDDGLDSSLDTAAEVHRVAASGDVLDGLGEDGTGENGSGGGTVTGDLVGLGSNILEELGTKVLELVLEADSAGNGHTICNKLVESLEMVNEASTNPW